PEILKLLAFLISKPSWCLAEYHDRPEKWSLVMVKFPLKETTDPVQPIRLKLLAFSSRIFWLWFVQGPRVTA
ncbi:hypothetical protein, partial [Pseudomonas sp. GW460-13]|uniref:hypothetical protein n=1 Tax=Pseudomonas sp. GW460-13 TaxID=2070590 RepID=UPI001304EF18